MDENQRTYLDGEDVTDKIRSKEVSEIVSQVSAIKEVRFKMVDLQRRLAKRKRRNHGGKRYNNICIPKCWP